MAADRSTEARFAAALRAQANMSYELELYVAGASPHSQRAITTLIALCERTLSGRYTLRVIDILQQPERASTAGIVAVPTLIRVAPQPTVRLIGDLSDEQAVLRGLDIAVEVGGV